MVSRAEWCKRKGRTSNWIVRSRREAIYKRDSWMCVYCRAWVGVVCAGPTFREPHLDHLVPRSLGGGNESANLVTACHSCNSSRHRMTLRQFFRRLRARGVNTASIYLRIRAARRRIIA